MPERNMIGVDSKEDGIKKKSEGARSEKQNVEGRRSVGVKRMAAAKHFISC